LIAVITNISDAGKGSKRVNAVLSRYGSKIAFGVYACPGFSVERIQAEITKLEPKCDGIKVKIELFSADGFPKTGKVL